MNKIAIMQGRLSVRKEQYQSFPYGTWGAEFETAKKLGFDAIEMIYDNDHRNPLNCVHGLTEIFNWVSNKKVEVNSICADAFMTKTLFDKDTKERIMNKVKLVNLIFNAKHIGITDIVIPCIETSKLDTLQDKNLLRESLRDCLEIAASCEVNLNLETDLNPRSFLSLLSYIEHPNVKVNYDTGNSAFMGYDPEEEINTYGDKISVVHIKDRKKGGPSVKLGTGDVDFEKVFKTLKSIGYKGQFTLQACRPERSTYSAEVNYVKEQFEILKAMLERWFYHVE